MTLGTLWRISRPPTLLATVVPVLVGTVAAAGSGPISLPLAALMAVVGLLIQAATNMINEYADWARGVDTPESIGIAGVLVSGELGPGSVRRAAWGTYALALVLGLVLVAFRGPVLLLLGLASIGVSVVYSWGPNPISATPFGEAVVLLFMGPLEVLVSEYAAAARLTTEALAASLPVGCMVALILLANNVRDRDGDARRGRRTLPIVLGPGRLPWAVDGLIAAAFSGTALLVALGLLPVEALVILLAAPRAWVLAREILGPSPGVRIVPEAARLHLLVGALLGAGLFTGALTGR